MTTICPVCYREVPVIQHAVVDLNVRLSVTCHGSTESKTFNGVTFMTAYAGETPRAVEEWLRTVFKSDTHPDVMLAIRYLPRPNHEGARMSQTYQDRPVVAVDIVALNGFRARGSSHVLLIKRDHEPYEGFWALPGGRLEPNEDLVPAAIREFKEEVGIEIFPYDLGQLGAYGKPGRDPRGDNLSVAFVVTMGRKVPPFAGDDAREAQWFDVSELPPLAFDHAQVIHDALYDERF